jgi:acetyl-CoA C-acetyltransferase
MDNVVIVAGSRTPIGAFQGTLSSLSATKLGSIAISSALARGKVSAEEVDEVLFGNVLSSGLGQAPARQAALGAGLPNSVPCTTINKVCGSGMKAVMMAAQAIRCGDAKIVIAGGMESMSNAPYALEKARSGYRMGNGTLIDLMIHDGLWDPYNNCHMGMCGDATASEFNFTREDLDEFSAESYKRASMAQASGRLAKEITPVSIPQRKGDDVVVDEDEEPGKGNPTKLPTLRPAFSKDGVTTAGNASSLDDGAAAMVLMSESEAIRRGADILARVKAYTQFAHAPERFTSAPSQAVEKLLAMTGLTVDDIDLFEINEAFAVVAALVAQQVGIPREKLNVNGGAVALGHPIGMTGARLVLTAAYELHERNAKYAIASPCIGGGEATAIILERVS